MYTINITEKAIEQLKKLPKVIQPKLAKKIDELATNPFPASAKKLKGFHALYRIRFSEYRIVYEVLETEVVITILTLGNRKDIYKQL
ncbi:MAG: type II toxin-antitoxin system RelE/ParE family toxin [Vampirovibrio sp.]|jgi:mRNA interferase RelE/StbE|nr:type II toxin-antitoxin system RelE/ParE family toxin [Vampirovibrio sp.]